MHDLESITPEKSVSKSRELQRKLYLTAKRNRSRRFHALYDRMYRPDILWRAWYIVKANGGTGGVDGKSFQDIENNGLGNFISAISKDLRNKTYRPYPVLRVEIPKPDGSKRPLGIPTIRDRVVQQACKLVIEPIFESNFVPDSYGFRPKKSAIQAVDKVRKTLIRNWWVVDMDIKGYFDTIDHGILMNLVKRRISDKRVLKLIRQWLCAGVMADGKYSDTTIGSPQGGVISPLLANIYLHAFDKYWNTRCLKLGQLIRYADDCVILCRNQKDAEMAYKAVSSFMKKLRLTLHPQKTRIVNMGNDGFDFLGYYYCKSKSKVSGKLVPYMWPSQKAMKAVRRKINEITSRKMHRLKIHMIVNSLNPIIRGWRNYFKYGNSTKQFNKLDDYVRKRIYFHINKCHCRYRITWDQVRVWYHENHVLERFYKPGMIGLRP